MSLLQAVENPNIFGPMRIRTFDSSLFLSLRALLLARPLLRPAR